MVLCLVQFLDSLENALPEDRVLLEGLGEVLGQDTLLCGVILDLLDQRKRA